MKLLEKFLTGSGIVCAGLGFVGIVGNEQLEKSVLPAIAWMLVGLLLLIGGYCMGQVMYEETDSDVNDLIDSEKKNT